MFAKVCTSGGKRHPGYRTTAVLAAALIVLAGAVISVRPPVVSAQSDTPAMNTVPYAVDVTSVNGVTSVAPAGTLAYSSMMVNPDGTFTYVLTNGTSVSTSYPYQYGLLPAVYGAAPAYTYSTAVSAPSPSVAVGPAPAYSWGGGYCSDASGGQVWVPAGAPTDNLNCPA